MLLLFYSVAVNVGFVVAAAVAVGVVDSSAFTRCRHVGAAAPVFVADVAAFVFGADAAHLFLAVEVALCF